MSHENDYSALDRPEILSILFYPRKDVKRASSAPNVSDQIIPVGEGAEIGCRLYEAGKDAPNLLYFHGNGETVGDHDDLAPLYNRIGINLMVADYRGYGMSTGSPTITAMFNDAHTIFQSVTHFFKYKGYSGELYLMGRSLGSASVAELAYHHQDRIKGLIIESGFADATRLMAMISAFVGEIDTEQFAGFSNLSKITSIRIPTLIIHGDEDSLVPVENGKTLYQQSGAEDKRLLIIPHADHNDILYRGMDDYFGAIKELINPDSA